MSNVTTIAPQSGLQLAIDGIMLEIHRLSEVRPVAPQSLAQLSELVTIAHTLCLRKRKYELVDSGEYTVEDLAAEEENACYDVGEMGYGYRGARPGLAVRLRRPGGAVRNPAFVNPAPLNMGAGIHGDAGPDAVGGGLVGEAMGPMLDLLKRQQANHEAVDAHRESRRDAEARRKAQLDTVTEIQRLTSILATEGAVDEETRRWAEERRTLLVQRVAELEQEPEQATPEEGAPETAGPSEPEDSPVHAACTNPECDQVQGPTWSYPDGTAAPCDICGSPMSWRGRMAQPPNPTPNPVHSGR